MNKRIATYLKTLVPAEYNVVPAVANGVNYLLDSYFSKIDQRMIRPPPMPWFPNDPDAHIKETWLNCEIHKMVSLNGGFPMWAKALNAYAFSMLFRPFGGTQASYELVPFLDQYEFKNMLKGSYSFRTQFEELAIGPGKNITLPVYGTFFVIGPSGAKLVLRADFGHDNPYSCSVGVLANPENIGAAEEFMEALRASIEANDIYYKQCLMYMRGSLGFCDITGTTWEDVILKDTIRQHIRNNTVDILKNMDTFQAVGMCPSRNTILISPPGMAKTTLFRAISNETAGTTTRIWCTGRSIDNPEHVTALFQAARSLAPCIMFIEDMDLFGNDRSSLSGADSRVLNEFLACLDGVQANSGVVVLASTNDVASMDAAVLRPGRFDVKIEVPLPDTADRSAMLLSFLKKLSAHPDQTVTMDIWDLAIEAADGLTGAYMKELAKSIIIKAVAANRVIDGAVVFCADDLNLAVLAVMENYRIGKKAKQHFEYT